MEQLKAWVAEDREFCILSDQFNQMLATRKVMRMTLVNFAGHFDTEKTQKIARKLYLTYLADDNAKLTDNEQRPMECVDHTSGVLDLSRFIEPASTEIKFCRRWTWKQLLEIEPARFVKAKEIVLRDCFFDKHDCPYLAEFLSPKRFPLLQKVDLRRNCFEEKSYKERKFFKKLLKRGLVVEW